jgi:hypothetical protein
VKGDGRKQYRGGKELPHHIDSAPCPLVDEKYCPLFLSLKA